MEKKADFHSLSRKAKVQYVWDYYKWPIAAAIAALCFVIYLIYHYATYRDPLLNVIMMNCNDSITADSKGFDEFLEACGYDPKEDSVSLTSSLQFSDGEYSTSYNDTQVLTLMLAAGGQDLFSEPAMNISITPTRELLWICPPYYPTNCWTATGIISSTRPRTVPSLPIPVRSSSPTMPGFTSTTIMIPAISAFSIRIRT